MINDFKIVPDYQTLIKKEHIDSTGKYIEIQKSKSYNYKVKLIKRGLKMIDRDGYSKFVKICFKGKGIGEFFYDVIHFNKNVNCILAKNNGVLYTTALLEKESNFSRAYINRMIKKLTEADILRRHGKNFMLNPHIFYPYTSDFNLKILQEYWDNDFKKSKELIASEIQLEINSMLEDAKEFVGASKIEFEKLKSVQKLT